MIGWLVFLSGLGIGYVALRRQIAVHALAVMLVVDVTLLAWAATAWVVGL